MAAERVGVSVVDQSGGCRVALMCSSRHWQAAYQLKPTQTHTYTLTCIQTQSCLLLFLILSSIVWIRVSIFYLNTLISLYI